MPPLIQRQAPHRGPTSIRELLRELKARGVAVDRTGGGHYRVYAPQGVVILPSTLSDFRSIRNSLQMLRRYGLDLKRPGGRANMPLDVSWVVPDDEADLQWRVAFDLRWQDRDRVPAVSQWARDLADGGGVVSEESLLQAYAPRAGNYDVYFGFIDPGHLPKPRLVGGIRAYDWSELQGRGSPPAPKVFVDYKVDRKFQTWRAANQIRILDGNHRVWFWTEAGYDKVPVWVLQRVPLGALGLSTAGQKCEIPT